MTEVTWRTEVDPVDVERVRSVVRSTGFFSDEEIGIAVELVEARLEGGASSDYEFVLADDRSSGALAGYAAFGRIPATESSFDVYWIAVDRSRQGEGLGRGILRQVEERVRALGGTRLYIDTSSREQYRPTHRFYTACGYALVAELADFYRRGDGRSTFLKVLDETPEPGPG